MKPFLFLSSSDGTTAPLTDFSQSALFLGLSFQFLILHLWNPLYTSTEVKAQN